MATRSEVLTPAELAAGLAKRLGAPAGPARSAGGLVTRPVDGPLPTPEGARPRIIAIDGRSGSGKTHLAHVLAPALGAPCVHLDDFVPGWDGLAASVDRLAEWVLAPLAAGEPARWKHWDWGAGRWGRSETLPPAAVVLVEGCGAGAAIARPWLSALLWVDADADQRARRLRARPDWPAYERWADGWARQEAALRLGDDPAGVADATVRTGADDAATLEVSWRG